VDANINMLHATMMYGVGRHVDNTHIVAVDNRHQRDRDAKLLEKLSQPTTLSHDMSDNTVLRFSVEAGDYGQAFGGPGHQIVAEKPELERACQGSPPI
jgi:hypothetical protein